MTGSSFKCSINLELTSLKRFDRTPLRRLRAAMEVHASPISAEDREELHNAEFAVCYVVEYELYERIFRGKSRVFHSR